ncbi:hypothetical protein GOBAR_AA01142 [Gossypium barbadense]|uniref:Uncharacterized protein n=1 Tax=Gossypium barbadense TaxID=3634 RepID=A0A2P5YV25_GOSBA|nr:hypothetical protein GOBAR_AA01142 [Gossypium barbadense]
MVQPSLQEMSLKEVHEPFSSNSRGPIHEDRRLQIEELDEWWTHKLRTPDKPNLRQNKLNPFSNQLKVGDRVLLDATDPHIVATTSNEEIPLTVLNIFPFGTVEVSHPRFGTYKPCDTVVCTHMPKELERVLNVRRAQIQNLRITRAEIREHGHVTWPCALKSINTLHYSLSSLLKNPNPSRCNSTRPPFHARTMSSSRGKKTDVPPSKKRNGASSSASPTTEIHHPLLQFPRGPQEELSQICRARALIAGCCINWATIEQAYLRRSSRRIMNYMLSLATYFSLPQSADTLWPLAQPPTILATPSISSPTILEGGERALASSTLTTPTSYGMRMIERHRGTYPPQYRLAQSTEEEAYEDIPDDVPPQQDDPPTQPPPPFCPVHATASYADISEHLTRFEQHCFQRFDNIDATLQQICQPVHISLPDPPREPSNDEDI